MSGCTKRRLIYKTENALGIVTAAGAKKSCPASNAAMNILPSKNTIFHRA
jgi:hypothetical protein